MKFLFYQFLLITVFFILSCSDKKNNTQKDLSKDSVQTKKDSVHKKDAKSDLAEDSLVGRVMSVTESYYEFVERFGQVEKSFINKNVILYNQYGDKIDWYHYLSDSSYFLHSIYKYDEEGNRIEQSDSSTYNYDEDGSRIELNSLKLIFKTTSEFDGKGNEVEIRDSFYINNKISAGKVVKKYDNSGRITELNDYNVATGNLNERDIHEYDDKGNEIQVAEYRGDGSLRDMTNCKFDDKGNRIEFKFDSAAGTLHFKSTSKYDNKGHEIERIDYSPDNSRQDKDTYKYDSNGHTIESRYYNSNGSLDRIVTSKYDKKGNEIETIYDDFFDRWKWKYSYRYEYDKVGNWTKKTTLKDDKAEGIVERQIKYYK